MPQFFKLPEPQFPHLWKVHGVTKSQTQVRRLSTPTYRHTDTYSIRVCCAQALQLCPTLCHPKDCSPPGSSFHVIFQGRTLKWIAMPSFSRSSSLRDQTWVSYVSFPALVLTTSTTWEGDYATLRHHPTCHLTQLYYYSNLEQITDYKKTNCLVLLGSLQVGGIQGCYMFWIYRQPQTHPHRGVHPLPHPLPDPSLPLYVCWMDSFSLQGWFWYRF